MTMLAQEISTVRGLSGWVQELTHSYAQWRAYRVSVAQLSMRSEHELEDLGIARDDIRTVARRWTYGARA